MRKVKWQQKNVDGEQLDLFAVPATPACTSGGGTGRGAMTGGELTSRLEQQRTLTENLMERIADYGNLNTAYQQVKSNKGSNGIDGMSVEELRIWLGGHYKEVQQQLLSGQYRVEAVREVEIPKPDGGMRKLGIPTVKDRLVQQAIYQELNRYYEPYFSTFSYGFRAGRSAWQAIEQASLYVSRGKEWVVDIDLEKFFDKINHDRLMQRLSKGIGDKRLLRLINSCLKAGIMSGGVAQQRTSGTPQGSPLSPLLSNIVLDELDKELEKRGLSFCRYADDCNIFVSSKKAGERVLESITRFIEQKLKLKVNKDKSGVKHCTDVKFLGYTIMQEGKIRVADKSIIRLKTKFKELTKRNRGVRFEQVISELNLVIIGWTNYFHMANTWLGTLKELDRWVRRKLRCYRLKQCGRKYTIFKFLVNLGIPERKSWNVVMYSQGWWIMSNKQAVNEAMNLNYFHRMGLQSLHGRINR